jgi:hypothetical protein
MRGCRQHQKHQRSEPSIHFLIYALTLTHIQTLTVATDLFKLFNKIWFHVFNREKYSIALIQSRKNIDISVLSVFFSGIGFRFFFKYRNSLQVVTLYSDVIRTLLELICTESELHASIECSISMHCTVWTAGAHDLWMFIPNGKGWTVGVIGIHYHPVIL